ncbi:MAG: glutathione transport system permease protein [Gaiellaceae bacterium]|nr:glutathione transport system permease protein [Gaiellaceae bacterium]
MSESTVEQPGVGPAPTGPTAEASAAEGLELAVRSQWSYARSRFFRHRLALMGLFGLAVIFLSGAFAHWVAPFPYDGVGFTTILKPPSWTHLFGTDELGRDELSRIIYGIRTSTEVGVFVALASTVIGVILGAIAGYYGSWIDNLLMRLTDLFLTLPFLAILLTAAKLLGTANQWQIVALFTFFFWTGIARIVRGVFLSLREKEYVEAAKASGASDSRIMFRHILPNTLGPIVVNATLAIGTAILTESALSFLGFGLKPPTASLGLLIANGENFPFSWWLTITPGLVIILVVLCVNLVGDGLRDALDPTQRRMRA